MTKIIYTLLLLMLAVFAGAQTDGTAPEMADNFRQEGKIYVVICVIGLIFVCLICYLFLLERKIKKLEDRIRAGESKN